MMVLAVFALYAESDAKPQLSDPVTEKVLAGVSGKDQDANLAAKRRWCIFCGNCCNTKKEKEAELALQR